MLVDTTVVLKNLAGGPMKDNDGQGNAVDATLKMAIANALLAPSKKEDSGVDKIKKYELAKKVHSSDEVDLDENEIKLIKDSAEKAFPLPLIVGQINELLKV